MRILLIAHYNIYANIPRSFRTLELAKELVNRGYNIDILIGSEKRIIYNFSKEINKGDINNQSNKEKKFKKLRKIGSFILNYLYGDMVIAKFYKSTKQLIANETNDYLAVISIGLPFYPYMMLNLKKFRDCVKICDCGDPFFIDHKRQAPYWGYIQKKVFRYVDYVCLPTEKAINYYLDYVDIEKIRVIPQGVNFEDFDISKDIKNNIPTFGYAGVFYEKLRDPSNFINYLEEVDKQFKFIIYTDVKNSFFIQSVKPKLYRLGDKVEIHDFLPRKECVKVLSSMDFLINFENKSSIQSPSKLIDYGIAKRPVLSFSSDTFDDNIFMKFLLGDYTDRLLFDISPFDIRKVTDQFEKLFVSEESIDRE